MTVVIGILLWLTAWCNGVKQHWPRLVLGWMTLSVRPYLLIVLWMRLPLALLLQRQYEFPFGINIVQFSIFHYHVDAELGREEDTHRHTEIKYMNPPSWSVVLGILLQPTAWYTGVKQHRPGLYLDG